MVLAENEIERLARSNGITELSNTMVINGVKYKRAGHMYKT